MGLLRWLPFGFGVFMAAWWAMLSHAAGCSLRGTVATSLLVGLASNAWFLIEPRGMRNL